MTTEENPTSPFERMIKALVQGEIVALTDANLQQVLVDRLERAVDNDDAVLRDLGTWLVDQDEVDEVYGSDLEIQAFLREKLNN
ncbi:MAG: hypothetical protein JKY37_23675 [Nannocystaceae bacterium]|nr:hypothetical protein [Nannocystaceae bacterium]